MALIQRVPPEPPRWQFCIDEDERGYLLCALDLAQVLIKETEHWDILAVRWPLPPDHYARMIGFLEKVVVSANPEDLR